VSGQSSISADVLATYTADAAREVRGVRDLIGNSLARHDGVKITRDKGGIAVELHIALERGASAGTVGAEVQKRVAETLARMADVRPESVDVVIDEFGTPAH
jgi:uncharacterized alkaline shock family protein YloU